LLATFSPRHYNKISADSTCFTTWLLRTLPILA
jgi:hypothetical protein